jgi:hypothetical protein
VTPDELGTVADTSSIDSPLRRIIIGCSYRNRAWLTTRLEVSLPRWRIASKNGDEGEPVCGACLHPDEYREPIAFHYWII